MADRKPFLLRIDEKLWRDLEAWAQEDLRSVNGQIEYLLKQAVDKRLKVTHEAEQGSKGQPPEGETRDNKAS